MAPSTGKKRKCPNCPKVMRSKNMARHLLGIHKIESHPPKGRQFYCAICEKWFALAARKKHYVVHHNGILPVAKDATRDPRAVHNDQSDVDMSSYTDTDEDTDEDMNEDINEDTGGEMSFDTDVTAVEVAESSRIEHEEDLARQKAEDHCKEYKADLDAAVIKASNNILDVVVRMGEKPKTRMEHDHAAFYEDLEYHHFGCPITPEEYFKVLSRMGAEGYTEDETFRYSYVVCGMDDAHHILEHASPHTVVVLRDPTRHRQRITVEKYLHYLEHKVSVEVHDSQREWTEDGNANTARWMETAKLAKEVMNDGPGVYNALNLAGYKQNSMPVCFEGLSDYDILQLTRENDGSGKPVTAIPNDLTADAEFTLFATKGAISLAHHDSQATITTLEVEDGEKLCLIWPYLDYKAKTEWQKGTSWSPADKPFCLYLKEGDILILPAGRVHAVYTMSTCLVTGRRFWDSRRMIDVVIAMAFERLYPHVTNEDEAEESMKKLSVIGRIWRHGSKYWRFGSDRAREGYHKILQHLKQSPSPIKAPWDKIESGTL